MYPYLIIANSAMLSNQSSMASIRSNPSSSCRQSYRMDVTENRYSCQMAPGRMSQSSVREWSPIRVDFGVPSEILEIEELAIEGEVNNV